MGSVFSFMWADSSNAAHAKPSTDAKYKQGIGSNTSSAAIVKSSSNKNGAQQQQQQPKFKSHTVGGAAARKKPKGKVNKAMIGQPANFQHTGHLGTRDMKGAIDIEAVKKQMGAVAPLSSSAPTSPSPLQE